jgi:hypothetical protein
MQVWLVLLLQKQSVRHCLLLNTQIVSLHTKWKTALGIFITENGKRFCTCYPVHRCISPPISRRKGELLNFIVILFNNMETPSNISCAPETIGIPLYCSVRRVTDIHIADCSEFKEFIVKYSLCKKDWNSCGAKWGSVTEISGIRNILIINWIFS